MIEGHSSLEDVSYYMLALLVLLYDYTTLLALSESAVLTKFRMYYMRAE
jgi:hypothetical protein